MLEVEEEKKVEEEDKDEEGQSGRTSKVMGGLWAQGVGSDYNERNLKMKR